MKQRIGKRNTHKQNKKIICSQNRCMQFYYIKVFQRVLFHFHVEQKDVSNHTYFHILGNNTLLLGLLKVWHFLFASWKQYSSSVIRNTYKNIFQLEFISSSKSKFQFTVTVISTIFFHMLCWPTKISSSVKRSSNYKHSKPAPYIQMTLWIILNCFLNNMNCSECIFMRYQLYCLQTCFNFTVKYKFWIFHCWMRRWNWKDP